jgi:hypothetical protein
VFGTLKPHRCALDEPVRAEHDRFYCGLCKSLGDRYGQLSRALVSHDAVFLALLVDGLCEEPAKDGRCRCPLLPVVHRPIVAPDGVAMRFAAAVQMLLGDQWLADRALEGKLLARAGRPLASRYVELAKADLARLGVDVAPLDGFETLQAEEERRRTESADPREEMLAVARPTAAALGFLLERIAHLEGATADAKRAETVQALGELGEGLGRAIYFADALDDLAKDAARGDFNPCLVVDRTSGERRPSGRRVEACADLLRAALADVRAAARALPLSRHREVIDNILAHELPRAARAAEAKARAHLDAVSMTLLARMSWLERGAHRLLVAIAVLFTWLFGGSRAAQAAPHPKRPSLPPAASVSPPDAGPLASASASAEPASGPPEPSSSPPPRDDDGNALSSGSGSAGTSSGAGLPSDVPTGPDSSKPGAPGSLCGKGCSGCCDDLCKSCAAPCKGCCGKGGSCCDGCKGCDACKCDQCCKCDGCCKSGDCCGGGGGGCCR